MDYKQSLRDHYGFPDLVSAIAQALKAQGKTIETITRDDLRALDEFHIQGRKATQELARRAGLQKGMKVLDLGCGIGGPARTLAAEFGCHVTGIDIVQEYCEAATFLTHHLGLSDRVRFLCGDVSELSDAAASYDLVWSQHVLMNIADKRRLLSEVHRVLRPNGIFAFFEICSGANAPSHFPVPWAGDESVHFPVSSDGLRSMLERLFQEKEWQDVSSDSLTWYRKAISNGTPPALGLDLLMGETAQQKMSNVVRNLEEDRIRIIRGVALAR